MGSRLRDCGSRVSRRVNQVGNSELLITECYDLLHNVFELADVPRPRMVQEHAERLGAQRRTRPSKQRGVLRQKEFHQQRYVFLAFPQSREPQANTVNSVIQLTSKAACTHLLIQIPARR